MRPLIATSSGEELILTLQIKSRLLLSIIFEDNSKARQAALFNPALINVFAVMLVHKVAKILCGPAKVINIAKRKASERNAQRYRKSVQSALKNIHNDVLLLSVTNKNLPNEFIPANEVICKRKDTLIRDDTA